MKHKKRTTALLGMMIVAGASTSTFSWAQSSDQSGYVFRFSPGTSKVMMDSMTFTREEAVNVDGCTINAKENGPILCALNCEEVPVCLFAFSGPSGLSPNDVLEKVDEATNPTAGSPSPTPNPSSRPLINELKPYLR